MNRAELELAIVTAARIVGQDHVLVIGSQSILGTYDETRLPARATASHEVDIAPLRDDDAESLATRLDVVAGEWSEFDEQHGFYIQGASVRTAYLPEGWADRVVEVRPESGTAAVGLCLEVGDLCAAKLARNAEKGREFVEALVAAGLVEPRVIAERLRAISDERFSEGARSVALALVSSYPDAP